jgi:chromosome segregation ATPase
VRRAEWDRLELAVRRLLEDYQLSRNRASNAERRITELEAALETLAGGGPDPIALRERIVELEAENQELRERLERARQEVERIMARLQFLEGQR